MIVRSKSMRWRLQGWRVAGLLAIVTAAVLSYGCINVQGGDGAFVMGGSIVVDEDEVARNDLVAIGGSILVDGQARRDVVVVGGSLVINGEVGRDVVCIGGNLRLGEDAHVGGNATVVGGSLDRHPDAVVEGELVNVGFSWGFDQMFGGWSPVWWGGWWGFAPFRAWSLVMKLVWWLLLALLTVALVGDRVSSAAHAVAREPIKLGAIGFFGAIALCFAMAVLIVLSLVLIGIPFALALFVAWVVAYVFGVVAVFQSVGSRVVRLMGRADASQIAIVMAGGIVLSVLRFFPFFGSILWFLVGCVGLGSVFATRFGTGQPWIRGRGAPAPPSEPPSPPPSPPEAGSSPGAGGDAYDAPPGGAGEPGGQAESGWASEGSESDDEFRPSD